MKWKKKTNKKKIVENNKEGGTHIEVRGPKILENNKAEMKKKVIVVVKSSENI